MLYNIIYMFWSSRKGKFLLNILPEVELMKLHLVIEHKEKKYKFRIHHYTYAFPIWIIAIIWLWLWLIPVGFVLFFSDVKDFYIDVRDKIYRKLKKYMKKRNKRSASKS